MRTTILSTALPNRDSGSGASITLALIAEALQDRGHDVTLCPIVYPEYRTPDGADHEEQLAYAERLGFPIEPVLSEAWRPTTTQRTVGSRACRIWRPDDEELYPTLRDCRAVQESVAHLGADAVLVYGFEALAASVEVEAPRFAATSDPPHLALWGRTWRRWRSERRPLRAAREAIGIQSTLRAHPRLALRLLRDCEAVGAFGRHHAEWLQGLGLECGYYRTPIADPGPGQSPRSDGRPTILLVGHLRGTATLDGLRVFARMLPYLDDALGRDSFEVRIVGGYEPPPELAPLFEHPAVQLLGFVPDVDAEFRTADVLLVPVSIKLGVRVRVLTGFSYGSCIVTHTANSYGIPELEHERNALVGGSPQELAEQVVRAIGGADLRARLGAGARSTYERYFTPAVAGAALAETLEGIAR
jgi:glycosyltransferase involved in cell wall biosynthesis